MKFLLFFVSTASGGFVEFLPKAFHATEKLFTNLIFGKQENVTDHIQERR